MIKMINMIFLAESRGHGAKRPEDKKPDSVRQLKELTAFEGKKKSKFKTKLAELEFGFKKFGESVKA